jgi:selenocysteine lyase/cysteine desulfurase
MNFKELFPALQNSTYLNTAASGILSRPVQQWRRQHDEAYTQQGSIFRLQQEDFLNDVRQHVARFLGGQASHTFLVQNFSVAFNTFLDGLSRDHKFILVDGDYPSVSHPVKSRGFDHVSVTPDENMEQHIADSVVQFKPTILALSLVQYTSGIKVNLDFIQKLKQEYPDLLIVADGTQFCGTQYFDFGASGLDVLIGSGYKWMLGGYGNGFMLFKDVVPGYLYQERQQSPLPREPFLKNKNRLSLCFEPGHLDTFNFGTLQQSILFLEELGWDFIEQRIEAISQMAKKAFADRGLLAPAVLHRAAHSSIFNIPSSPALAQQLHDMQILLSPRGTGLRTSFHFYNDEQDLEQLLQVLDRK